MSFMFNPHPYNDPSAVNRPALDDGTVASIVTGAKETAGHLGRLLIEKAARGTVLVALDGYIGAQFTQTVNLISQHLKQAAIEVKAVDISRLFKPGSQLDKELADNLKEDREKDPVLLFGKLFKGGYEDLFDAGKLKAFRGEMESLKKDNAPRVVVVYGCGCSARALRQLYDLICWFDLSPKETILRARRGSFANLGDSTSKPIKALLRRCYYVDFEIAGHLRWDLIKADAIDFYLDSTVPDDLKLLPRAAFDSILAALAKYPLRCKPVYLEGVWGGHYIKKLRHLPDSMHNCAWVFDFIPLEVSLVVEAGNKLLEFPFFTFAQKQGQALMGAACVRKFKGYFPLRFNYDDSYHSSGNMSIQVHSGHAYNVDNFGEHGRQDESYYVVATGHGARTYIGFNEAADPDEFIREVKKSETEFTPVDYRKYVNHIDSR
ncbi:phosphoheptose isomerase, partial [bacterium]|nr:phosphoheptose isomerase [bacterium]